MYQKTSGTGASASGARACSVCVASLCSASRRRLSEASTRTESRVVLAPAASPAPAVGPLFKLVCRFEWAQSDIRTLRQIRYWREQKREMTKNTAVIDTNTGNYGLL